MDNKRSSVAALCLSTLGKNILAVREEKYKYLVENSCLLAEEENPGIVEILDKTNCKICLENEARISLVPCGHLLCAECLRKIRDFERKKLRNIFTSERVIDRKMKIMCYQCRTEVKDTQKIFF